MVDVTFKSGLNAATLTAAAAAFPIGQQKAKYSSDVATALGNNPIFEIRIGSTVVYASTVVGALSGSSAGITVPTQFAEPPTTNQANALTDPAAVIALRHATNSNIELTVPVRVGVGDWLAASEALDGTEPVRTNSLILRAPEILDVGTNPGSSSNWLQTALTDMRRDPATGSYSYANSYATNEAKPYLRTRLSYSSQYDRAQLTMGRYPNPTAFTSTNPDYNIELEYVDADDPARTWPNWQGLMWWGGIFLSEEFSSTSSKHAQGYTNNSRVMIWDCQVWRKTGAGVWVRHINTDTPSGEAWYPDFRYGYTSSAPGYDRRIESAYGYPSYRTTPSTGTQVETNVPPNNETRSMYRIAHPYGGLTSWGYNDVTEIVSSCKASLVLHNASGTDDRDYARFLMHNGADYYPEPSPGSGLPYYFGVGSSRLKYVRAKYPDFQFHVMHTATWANLEASYPDIES